MILTMKDARLFFLKSLAQMDLSESHPRDSAGYKVKDKGPGYFLYFWQKVCTGIQKWHGSLYWSWDCHDSMENW